MLNQIPYCFAKADVIKEFKNKAQFDNWLKVNIKNQNIKKVRNELYVALDSMNNIYSTKFEIASKISDSSFICYHSALEYYGIANQVFSDVTVGSKTRFNSFKFDDVEYICKPIKNYEQVDYIVNEKIRISSLERTIVDCIDNINFAGGIEEILNALEQIKVLNEQKLLDVLKSYNQVLLYQKLGYVLEQYKDQLMLSDCFFEECEKHLTNQVKYFLNDEYKEIKFNSKWKLMVPKALKSRVNEGL